MIRNIPRLPNGVKWEAQSGDHFAKVYAEDGSIICAAKRRRSDHRLCLRRYTERKWSSYAWVSFDTDEAFVAAATVEIAKARLLEGTKPR